MILEGREGKRNSINVAGLVRDKRADQGTKLQLIFGEADCNFYTFTYLLEFACLTMEKYCRTKMHYVWKCDTACEQRSFYERDDSLTHANAVLAKCFRFFLWSFTVRVHNDLVVDQLFVHMARQFIVLYSVYSLAYVR